MHRMRLLWLLASVAAASAFHATPTLQPAIAIRVPPSASVALSLRGGGMVDQAACARQRARTPAVRQSVAQPCTQSLSPLVRACVQGCRS